MAKDSRWALIPDPIMQDIIRRLGERIDSIESGGDVADGAISVDQISSDIAGNGLTGGSGSALAVNPDNSSIYITSDAVTVKPLGIATGMLAAGVLSADATGRAKMAAGFFGAGDATSEALFADSFMPDAKLEEDYLYADGTRSATFLVLTETTSDPGAVADGRIYYADGTSWNPGGTGEGFYGRVAGAWQKL